MFQVLTLLQLSMVADRDAVLTKSRPSSEDESALQNNLASPNAPELSAGDVRFNIFPVISCLITILIPVIE